MSASLKSVKIIGDISASLPIRQRLDPDLAEGRPCCVGRSPPPSRSTAQKGGDPWDGACRTRSDGHDQPPIAPSLGRLVNSFSWPRQIDAIRSCGKRSIGNSADERMRNVVSEADAGIISAKI
jgi:hypothetical protein